MNIEDPGQLRPYLEHQSLIRAEEPVEMCRLEGGVSNRAVLIERPGQTGWVVKQALEKLRVQVDWFSDPQRIHREALGLRRLGGLLPEGTVPGFVFEDEAHHVLIMTAVPKPHVNWKSELLLGRVNRSLFREFGEILGQMHARAYRRHNEIRGQFEDRSFFRSLRLEPYYGYSGKEVPEVRGFLDRLTDEAETEVHTLVHGDYSPKNILIRNGRLVLLDYEVIHWGDPAFDLGFSLTHLLSKAHHVSSARAEFLAGGGEYWATYRKTIGEMPWLKGLEERAVRHTLGCLLARVVGRSPLEYLTREERERQRSLVVRLMSETPRGVPELIEAVGGALDS